MHKSSKLVEANPLSLLQHERNYRNHLTRLLDISVSKGSLSNRQKNINDHDVRLQKNQEFQRRKQNRRLLEIEKDNAKLLLKIMEINIGKRTSKSQPKIPTLVLETDRSVVQQENSPRGNSNTVNRKKEYTRIENENKKLSERLVLQESNFAKERMNREYQQNREYSSRLRKVRISSDNVLEVGQGAVKFSKDLRITSHTPYLPPLNPISSHTYRASSVSRVNTDTSCRSATKGTVSVISARNREKTLKTEIDTSENAIKGLARCQSSPNYKFLVQENGSVTDRVYGRNPSPFQKKVKGSPVKASPVKYRQGEFIFDTKKDGSVAEGIIKARSSQSRREQGEEMLIREESQAKEESLQRSRLENYESRNLSDVGRKGLVKGKEERQVTEEYEQIYEAESRYESKTNNAKTEFRSNRETEGYPEDYESLVESVKAGY